MDTDDPVAYVKAAEKNDEVEIGYEKDGSIVIRVQRDDYRYWVKYIFTED